MDTEPSPTRRRLLAGLATVGAAALGGCVTTGLSLRTDDVAASNVFDSVSLAESWTANKAVASLKLTESATTERNVRELAVVDSEGSSVWSDTVKAGQTSVSDVRLPVGESATITATDNTGAFVDSVTVTIGGSSFP